MKNDDFFHEMGDSVELTDKNIANDSKKSDVPNHSQKSLVDISNEVEKKQEDGETVLYFQSQKIGHIRKKGHSQMYEMSEGFEFENEKFFKDELAKKQKQPESYVEGCDMGWC